MATWDELRRALARLLEQHPDILTYSPDLGGGEAGQPPSQFGLVPWAADAAGWLS